MSAVGGGDPAGSPPLSVASKRKAVTQRQATSINTLDGGLASVSKADHYTAKRRPSLRVRDCLHRLALHRIITSLAFQYPFCFKDNRASSTSLTISLAAAAISGAPTM